LIARWLVAAALTACGAAAGTAASGTLPAPAAADTQYVRRVDGIPVRDSAGTAYRYPFLGGLDRPRPQLIDIDADGDLDLFLQEYTGWLQFFERDDSAGQMRYVWRTDRYADLPVGEWSRFVDADGDGDQDMFAEAPYSFVRWYRNDGSATRAQWVVGADSLRDPAGELIFADRQNIPQLGDLDCNGRLDLMLGRVDGSITRYEMPAGAGPASFTFVTDAFENIKIIGQTFGMPAGNVPSMHGANTMAIVDVDDDGDQDILWGDFFEAGLLWIVNDGTCELPHMRQDFVRFPPNDSVMTSGYNAPYAGDLDGDGDLDLLMGVLGGAFNPVQTARENLYHFEQAAPGQWELRTRRLLDGIDLGSETVTALSDLDSDGDLDLVVGSKLDAGEGAGSLTVFTNDGSATVPSFREAGTLAVEAGYQMAPAFGDLDGDGHPDLVLGSWRDQVAWYRNEGGMKFTMADSAAFKLSRGSHASPTLGDLDGDGDLDVVVGENSGEVGWFRNVGSRSAPTFELVTDTISGVKPNRRSAPRLVDLDADGDLDIVTGDETGELALYRNVGSATEFRFQRDSAWNVRATPFAAPAFGDIDGDGDLDILSGGASGGVVFHQAR
jgi:hypothetical protein